MPKSPLHLALARLWEILKKLPPRGPGLTAGQITAWLKEQGYRVSKRTVERDLIGLSTSFGLVCNDKSVPYGWHWMPGRQCEFAGIELTDAVSLVLVESTLRQLLPVAMLEVLRPKFDLARSKLAAQHKNPYARWIDKVRYVPAALGFIPPRVDGQVLAVIHEALLQERQVSVTYTAHSARKAENLTLHPLSLIQRGATPYLVATAYDYPDIRLYAIHRMKAATLTENKSKVPMGYTIDRYVKSGAMEFGAGKVIRLRAWVSNELGIYLAETPLATDQSIKSKSGHYLLSVSVVDSWQLRWWIQSQGASITVCSPKHLRTEIAQSLNAAAQNYRDN